MHKPILVEKPWGSEVVWAQTDSYVGKILRISKGHKLSLQKHIFKEETIRILKGSMLFTCGPDLNSLEEYVLKEGDCFHIPPGTIHRMEAIEYCEAAEVSTTELDDVVRIQDDYDRVP